MLIALVARVSWRFGAGGAACSRLERRAHKISRRKVSPRKINPCSLNLAAPHRRRLHATASSTDTFGSCACTAAPRSAAVPAVAGQLPQITVTAPPVTTGAASGRPAHAAADSAAGDARRTAHRKTKQLRCGAQQSLHHRSARRPTRSASDTIQALPQGSNAPVEQRYLAGAGRIAGFRRQRAVPRPQRSRQRTIPHQRRDAARRRYRLRQRSRHRADRQHLADYRRACRPNMGCVRRACSTSPPAPTFSIIPAASVITAAAAAPSSRASNMAAPIGANCPSTAASDRDG